MQVGLNFGTEARSGAGRPDIDPQGQFLFVPTAQGVLCYRINAATSNLELVIGSPFVAPWTPSAIAVDPSGQVLYALGEEEDDRVSYRIDRSTGALSLLDGVSATMGDRMKWTLVTQ